MSLEMNKLKLYDSYYENKDINQLLNCAATLLDNPMIITSASYRVIFLINHNNIEINDPIWKFAQQFGYCSAESIQEFKKAGVTTAVHESENPIMIDFSVGEKLPRVIHKIQTDHKILGYYGLFQLSRKITSEDMVIIETLCKILATALKLDKSTFDEFQDTIHDDIIIELLENKIYKSDVLKDRLKSADWHIQDYFHLITIPLYKNNTSLYYHNYFREEISGKITISKITLFNDTLIVLLNSGKERHLDYAKTLLADIINQHELKAYISNRFDNLLSLSNQYYLLKEIALVIDLMPELNKGLFEANDYLQISLLQASDKHMDLSKYVCKEYENLNQNDQKHGSSYIKTLLAYINCACNIKKSAECLYLHRNTMRMRLTQIEQIIGPLNDGAKLQRIYASDLIVRLKNRIDRKSD